MSATPETAFPTPDDIRHAWWPINGLIAALAMVNEEGGDDEMDARGAIVTALRRAAKPFSALVEEVADGMSAKAR